MALGGPIAEAGVPGIKLPAPELGGVRFRESRGSTTPRHGPENALPSILRTSRLGMEHIQTGNITSLFPRTEREWSAPRWMS